MKRPKRKTDFKPRAFTAITFKVAVRRGRSLEKVKRNADDPRHPTSTRFNARRQIDFE